MKIQHLFGVVLALILPNQLFASMPHLDLEMTSREYDATLAEKNLYPIAVLTELDPLEQILKVGKRNLEWLEHINKYRGANNKLSFSSKETQTGIPIDQPRTYSPKTIVADYDKLLGRLPEIFRTVLIEEKPFTNEPPISDDEYIAWGRKVDTSYQIASRWLLIKPWLSELEERRSADIRGVYFFSKVSDLESKLTNWQQLDSATQNLYLNYLISMCWNNRESGCDKTIQQAIQSNQVLGLYERYLPKSKDIYDEFFNIQNPRKEGVWNSTTLSLPFKNPGSAAIRAFLKDNIEDEWRWSGWRLILDFVEGNEESVKVLFEPGVTPNVNALGGNIITMDANEPLSEYNVQWTIRHEFGHVLGFPDCYLEFYDRNAEAITSYQIDTSNIMCSRRGHLQERHFHELERNYGTSGVLQQR